MMKLLKVFSMKKSFKKTKNTSDQYIIEKNIED